MGATQLLGGALRLLNEVQDAPSLPDSVEIFAPGPDMEHLLRDFPGFMADNWPWIVTRVAIFVGTVLVFVVLGRVAKRLMRRALDSDRVKGSDLLERTIVSITGRVITLLGLLLALSFIGIQLGPVIAGLGIAGFVLGLALQDSLSNFAAGTMILVYGPFDIGDVVEVAGVPGTVDGMSLVSTTILTADNQRVIIPNAKIWGDVIKNVTAQDARRVDMVFGIGYEDDIEKAEGILRRVVSEHPKVHAEPAPVIRLANLGDSSVDFVVRPWCDTSDYWDVKWGITREVKLAFDSEGISIPFPQRDVHLHTVDGGGARPST